MKLNYTDAGKFVPETRALLEELEADAIFIMVFGSRIKGSGACCEMQVNDPEKMARALIREMRALADALEADMQQGSLKQEDPDDHNGHQQEEQQYRPRGLRPGQPEPGDHI